MMSVRYQRNAQSISYLFFANKWVGGESKQKTVFYADQNITFLAIFWPFLAILIKNVIFLTRYYMINLLNLV